MTHMEDFNAVVNRAIDDDITSARHNKTTMLRSKFRAGYPNVRVVRQEKAPLLKSVDESECICRTVLSDVIVNLLKVGASLWSK